MASLAFRVLTYNIHKAVTVDRRFRPDLIAGILRHHDADVVLLQEVTMGLWRRRKVRLGEELARACGYPYHATHVNVHYTGWGYGNATLSRFPIRRLGALDLTLRWRKRRGCLHTYHDLPGTRRRLRVFNVHLGLSAMERERQVHRILASRLVQDMPPHQPLVLGGDFNDWRSLLFPKVLAPAGFTQGSRHGRRFAPRTFPSWSPVGALDRVFVRGDLRVLAAHTSRLEGARMASDHLPVVVDLELVERRA